MDSQHEGALNANLRAWIRGARINLLGADTVEDIRSDHVRLLDTVEAIIGRAVDHRDDEELSREVAGDHPEGSSIRIRALAYADIYADMAIGLEASIASALGVPTEDVPDHPPASTVQPSDQTGSNERSTDGD